MYVLPIILATLLGVATSGTVKSGVRDRLLSSDFSTRNSVLEELLWDLLDTVREVMINGNDDVPVLDPFELDELHVDGDLVDLPNSHVSLKNLTVLNLSTFEVDHLSVSLANIILQRYRITLDGRIPVLEVQTGNYDLLIDIFGGNIFGNGDMKAKIINPRLHGNLVVGLRLSIQGIFLTITECRLSFSLESFEPEITGMFGNQVTSDFVSEFLRILIPEMVEYFEEDITDLLSATVLEVGNDILRDLDLGSILP